MQVSAYPSASPFTEVAFRRGADAIGRVAVVIGFITDTQVVPL